MELIKIVHVHMSLVCVCGGGGGLDILGVRSNLFFYDCRDL